ncbi:MFS transporter [Gordonia sp. ABSL11-1]|uniref:MFS transporter n=1 Tax=Gordonia sp. ABSL11-1 TaxID=3053924 RepID=UPI002572B383|nr:MFS transporter [Gordonia sp. ABSL11-1]MDL9945314.1 MFS transporter [Gordonia sp. ABSL11-1]
MPAGSAGHTRYGLAASIAAMVVLVAQTAAPSPLYPDYQQAWGLTAVTIASVFAVYVVGLLIVLLTAGGLSDHIGRKPVVITAGVLALAGLILLALAESVTVLVIARILQGASVGLVAGTLGAALMDFHLPGRIQLSAMLNGALPPLALAVGALGSAALTLVLPAPRQTVYLVFAAATVAVTALWIFAEERSPRRPGALHSMRPALSIPRRTRPVFLAVISALCAAWALAGLYVGSATAITHQALELDGVLVGGLAILALQVPAAITGIATGRVHARPVVLAGLGALFVGSVLTVVALWATSTWGFFAATIVAGIGFGAAFQGGLRLVLAETPEDARSGVLSGVYVVSYLAFGVPSVIAGFLTPAIGFTPTTYLYLAFVAILALAALLTQLRPGRAAQAEEEAEVEESLEVLDDAPYPAWDTAV